MNGNLLPIGSVVELKNVKKKVMITGFCMYDSTNIIDKKIKIYNYVGCLFPEGIITNKKNLLFNHNDIEKIYFEGYSDEQEKEYKNKLKILIEQIETLNV